MHDSTEANCGIVLRKLMDLPVAEKGVQQSESIVATIPITKRRHTMPTAETLERFIAQVESNEHADACEAFYAEDSSMQENQSPPRIGRDAHVAAERQVMTRARSIQSTCVRPVFVNGDHVVIRWIFEFEWQDGSVTRMEELAYQRWQGEKIAAETFFYDPAQRVPHKPQSDTR